MKQPLLNYFHWTKPHHIFSESRERRISRTYPTPTLPALYIQYACKIWTIFYDIASYKCRPDGYQSQITFNKTTWNDETIPSEQFPLNKTPSHFLWVTWQAHFPDLPHPHLTGSIHTIRVQDLNDFYAIASYKCRPDGYQSQITFNKTTWKRWNNPFWTIFHWTKPHHIFSESRDRRISQTYPTPTLHWLYNIQYTRARFERFLWYSFI